MTSVLQLVEIYENLAAQDEAMADRIVSAVDGLPREVQNTQAERANLLRRDAQFLRALAVALKDSCSQPTSKSA